MKSNVFTSTSGHDAHARGDHHADAAHHHSGMHADEHARHGGHSGHVDHVGMFRRLFWVMLAIGLPVVAFSDMFAMMLGYRLPDVALVGWVSPVLGTVMYVWGGKPFLTGAVSEVKGRQPGMMLLVAWRSRWRSCPPGARSWVCSATSSTSGGSWRF